MHQQKLERVRLELGALASLEMPQQRTENPLARLAQRVALHTRQPQLHLPQLLRERLDRFWFLAGLVRRHGVA
jgi:hypothetical protein